MASSPGWLAVLAAQGAPWITVVTTQRIIGELNVSVLRGLWQQRCGAMPLGLHLAIESGRLRRGHEVFGLGTGAG